MFRSLSDAQDDRILFANRELIKFAGCKDFEVFFWIIQGSDSGILFTRMNEILWRPVSGNRLMQRPVEIMIM